MARKVIRVKKMTVDKLSECFNCSRSSIYDALAYRSFSDTAEEIRKVALKEYGGIITKAI